MRKPKIRHPFLTVLLAADLLLLLFFFAGSISRRQAGSLAEDLPDYRETAALIAGELAEAAGEHLELLDAVREAALAVPCESLRMQDGTLFLDGKEVFPARREQIVPGLRALVLELQQTGLEGDFTAIPGEGSVRFSSIIEDVGSDRLYSACLVSPPEGEAPSDRWGSGVVPVSGEWEVLWHCTPSTAECGNSRQEPQYLYGVLILGAVFLSVYLTMVRE